MACARGLCAAEKVFIFINIAFAMYAGALLATAARLAWDPSTYTWFRFLCKAQYRVSAAYVAAAGLALIALVYLAAGAAAPRRAPAALHTYCVGVLCLVASEVTYIAWMGATLSEWWRTSPQAEMARRGMDLVHDLKPALLAVERYRDLALPVYDMIEEMEREAPNNVFVIVIFTIVGAALQIAAFIMARRLARQSGKSSIEKLSSGEKDTAIPCGEDSDIGDVSTAEPSLGWRKNTNLRMYTILDKIF